MAQFDYRFTEDWFSRNIPVWRATLEKLRGTPARVLEIGSFEGRSCVWLCENILTHLDSRIYCVDTFEEGDKPVEARRQGLYELFQHNTSPFKEKVISFVGPSGVVLKTPELTSLDFDMVYVDGDHRAFAALQDAVLAFPMLKVGGFMIFDDYLGGEEKIFEPEMPHMGIQSFVDCYKPKLRVVYAGYQLIVQKLSG